MRYYSIPETESILPKTSTVEMHLILREQGLPVRSPYAILMTHKLQFSGWDAKHRKIFLKQDPETVVHQCNLVMQLLILWKPEQLAEDDDEGLSNCSNVVEQCPQVVDQQIGIQVTDVILTNVQEHNGGMTSQRWLKLAVDVSTVVTESHSGTASTE